MAKFLDGAGVQAALIEIIKNAESELFIITPYMKISQQTRNYLKNTEKKNIQLTIISRTGTDIPPDTLAFLNELPHAKKKLCDNLHAKCFLNEKQGLITTMNLHEHSQTHNWEMGIQFFKQVDPDLYTDVLKEIREIDGASKESFHIVFQSEKSSIISKPQYPIPQEVVYTPKEPPKKGTISKIIDSLLRDKAFCIRCGKPMEERNPEKPLCHKCYSRGFQHNRPNFPEKYCHFCGGMKPHISYKKPICYDCYKENQK